MFGLEWAAEDSIVRLALSWREKELAECQPWLAKLHLPQEKKLPLLVAKECI